MPEHEAHVLVIGDVPGLIFKGTDYLVHTIAQPTSEQYANWGETIGEIDPLLVIHVISNESASAAESDLKQVVGTKSYPVLGLHLIGTEGPALVLTESCDINRLDYAIVCDSTIYNINEIVQWPIQTLIPSLATQRLSALAPKQSLADQLLRKPDPRPFLKKLSSGSTVTAEGADRQLEITVMADQIYGNVLPRTENIIYIEVEKDEDVEKLKVGTTIQITDGNEKQDSFVIGRLGKTYALDQTTPPISLRDNMRMTYTTKVKISAKGERTVLGYNISPTGMAVERPEGLDLAIGMEIFVTTKLEEQLQNFNVNIDLNREPGRIARFFEQDGKQFIGIEFKTSQTQLSGIISRIKLFARRFDTLMGSEKRNYERELAEREKRRQALNER